MSMNKKIHLNVATIFALALLTTACTTTPDTEATDSTSAPATVALGATDDRRPPDAVLADSFEILPEIETPGGKIEGDLEFLNTAEGDLFDVEAFRRQIEAEERPSGIVFNFEGADIKRVVAVVIGAPTSSAWSRW
jgi:hypothetical protein